MILVIDDDIAVRVSLELMLRNEGYDTRAVGSPNEAFAFLNHNVPSLIILDMNFSLNTSGEEGLDILKKIRKMQLTVPVILITGWATIELAVKGMKAGASDFVHKPWNNEYLLQTVRTQLKLQKKEPEKLTREKLDDLYKLSHIIGKDKKMLEVLSIIGNIASTDAPVLITGESGTGKELIAEAIHQNSMHASRPFVKVNLGGISSSLFESEMFGHVRGAFTDAKTDRTGRFEMANRGTIFLDEIGDLDISCQVKLLRVLQDRTFEVLGSSKTRTVDTRVICATNKNLGEMIRKGEFREDLYYRINLITLQLPPLRERTEDIPLLVNSFLKNLSHLYNRDTLDVTTEAMQYLKNLDLPGNIRELKNIVERAVLLSPGKVLGVNEFRSAGSLIHSRTTTVDTLPQTGLVTLEELEVQMIKKAMDFHKNRVSKVAKSLGITRSALYRRLDKYKIPYDDHTD